MMLEIARIMLVDLEHSTQLYGQLLLASHITEPVAVRDDVHGVGRTVGVNRTATPIAEQQRRIVFACAIFDAEIIVILVILVTRICFRRGRWNLAGSDGPFA